MNNLDMINSDATLVNTASDDPSAGCQALIEWPDQVRLAITVPEGAQEAADALLGQFSGSIEARDVPLSRLRLC
jgi:hypothetical protein